MNFVLRNHNGFPVPFAFRRTPANGSFDRLFDSVVEDYFAAPKNKTTKTANTSIAPRINITESEQAYIVEAEIPGVTKENVKISVDGKHVTLEAEVKRDVESKEGETVIFAERTVQKFSRSFTLAVEVDDERTIAKLENGILTLTLPKKEALRPKQIQVQ
ncbi:MAG TPA: Hsp20/alpha crystallin family protein [Burkholderiaceae bacterium]|nr:Hsp20/alpha crystallin family protein [Burkholderiaceae bacterium]